MIAIFAWIILNCDGFVILKCFILNSLKVIIWGSYILNVDLQRSFVMVKVLGKLIALVIEGKDCLEKGQHLQESKTESITQSAFVWKIK